MNILSKLVNVLSFKREMNSNNLEKLPPFMNWYAFEKKDQFSAVINFDHTSSLEITNDLISHSDKGQLSIKDIKSRRSLYLDFLKVHHKNISVAVDKTKVELAKFSPKAAPHEAKEWEWFRVSMQIAKESIKNFNPLTSSLEYKIFAGKISEESPFVLRVIYYNLDIVFELGDTFFYRVKDNKGSPDKSKHVVKEAPIPSLYNDFLNVLIEFLLELKNTELKVLTIDDES
ncbi:MAG: hypothetical protein CME69_06565 [Halobacteriovorax sp.]|nr:hypothetical protein [Halobacteriovorax sp.]|tara:strand:+ start:1691 stop:2380 length:690 start_codon:yes stop_codon:yes gene_type:complete